VRILGRDIELGRIPPLVWSLSQAAWRTVVKFQRPWRVLAGYLRQRSPDSPLRLRDGTTLHLSSYHGDIVTVFVVFCKEEYGTDFEARTVLDIGANIGTFAVLAAKHGCRRLVAVEPSLEAFQVLSRNLQENGLADRCTALHAAVCGEERGSVPFPVASSALNSLHLDRPTSDGPISAVATTTLGRLLEDHFPDGLDLLKMDCEGAEIEIVAQSRDEDLRRVRAIRMEFHGPDPGPTRQRLESLGFQVDLYDRLGPVTHTLWMSRRG
jgi:FkbM family methyltransferase